MALEPRGISQKVAVGDPRKATNVLKVNDDGSINVLLGGDTESAVVGILNADGDRINAMTEETGQDIVDALNEPVAYLPLPGAAASSDTTLTRVLNNISTATDTPIVTATASQTTRVYRLLLTCAGANVLTFKSASTAIMPAITFGSSGGSVTLDFSGYWWMKTATNEALNLTTTTTAPVGVTLDYIKSA